MCADRRAPSRRGTLLIIVAGLASILIAMSLAFFSWLRQESQRSQETVQEARARIMLNAGLLYLQEGSRLGWGDPVPGSAADIVAHGGLAFGWTDVRDGGLGPRGQRPAGADSAPTAIPAPRWWQASWPAYTPHPTDALLPPADRRTWPCPGSAVRQCLQRAVRPPFAVHAFPVNAGLGQRWPIPVADQWTDFASGRAAPAPATVPEERMEAAETTAPVAWFRIYRELLGDHDADGFSATASPAGRVAWAFDSVALHDPSDPDPRARNWNVFVITAGAGGTRGFRFWDVTDAGFSRGLEPVTARESGLFYDEQQFRELQRLETRLWFRAEWSGMRGGTADGRIYQFPDGGTSNAADNTFKDGQHLETNELVHTGNANLTSPRLGDRVGSVGGNFRFIQRLPQMPPNW